MSRPRLIALLLAFATLLVFLPVGSYPFVNYDDTDYITENPFVKSGLTGAGLRWAFTAFHAGNWHPLTWISHMADCELFQLNASAHHFVNALFHAANVALLFLLLRRWTEKIWPAAVIAALFAWHPLHVESVAWISERKDVLSAFFALLSLLAYTKFARNNCRRSYWLAWVYFALGLLAKPMLVTLPCLLLLLDFWPLRRMAGNQWQWKEARRLVVEKIPFFLLTATSCVITFLAQRQGEAVVSLTKVSLPYRLENAPIAVVNYLLKLFWPTDLCAIYPMLEEIAWLPVGLSVAVLILISVAAWHWRQAKPYLLVGWLWFLGTLVPVIGLVQVGSAAMADRYTYLPSIGLFTAVVFLLNDFAGRIRAPKVIVAGACAALLAGSILATENQLRFWRDSETLFRRAIAVTRHNDIALVNLGVALEMQHRLDEALVVYRAAAKLENGRYQLHNNLGNILDQLGRHTESLAEYREALRLRPGNPFLVNAIGSELAALGQYDAALQEFTAAEQLNPRYAQPHAETAKVYFLQGRDAEAVEELRTALRCEPENFQILAATARYLAANENAAARDGKSALVLATKANLLTGGSQPMVFDVLGMALAETGDFTNAQTCAENALVLATSTQMKNTGQIQQRLELYKNRLPWRESFRATNAPVKN